MRARTHKHTQCKRIVQGLIFLKILETTSSLTNLPDGAASASIFFLKLFFCTSLSARLWQCCILKWPPQTSELVALQHLPKNKAPATALECSRHRRPPPPYELNSTRYQHQLRSSGQVQQSINTAHSYYLLLANLFQLLKITLFLLNND